MSDKSYVAMEQHQCPICLQRFDTGDLLLDQHLRNTLEHNQLTGHSPCKDCQNKLDQGYIALIEAAESPASKTVQMSTPRTGNVAWIRSRAWGNIFDAPLPENSIGFIDKSVFEMLQKMSK